MPTRVQHNKNQHGRRKAAGLCVRCGKAAPRPGRDTCACALAYEQARKQKLAARGCCNECAEPLPPGEGKKLCPDCLTAYAERNRELRANRVANGLCLRCGGASGAADKWCESCREKARLSDQKLKLRVIAAYGGSCGCCGESEPRFLTLDHINGGGSRHREEVKGKLYRWVVRNNFPPEVRILCFNCNCGRAVNGGVCPHADPLLKG